MYIRKVKKTENGKTTVEYRTYGWSWRDGKEWVLDYPDLEWALDDLNSLCDGEEGVYPSEVERSWVILTMPKTKHEQEEKPFAYQFSGFRKEEEE